ncbi:MAG: septum site-determining protein MinC [Myxococcota bacterium]
MNPAAERAARGPFLELRFDQTVPVLVLDEVSNVETLRAAIRNSMPDHLTAIAGRATRLDIGAREITLFDLRRVIHMLKQDYSVEVTGLYVRTGAVHRFAERELKLKLFLTDAAPPAPPAPRPSPVASPPVPHAAASRQPTLDEEPDTEEYSDGIDEITPIASAPAILEPTVEVERLQRVSLPHDIQPGDLGLPYDDLVEPPEPEPADHAAVAPTPAPAPSRDDWGPQVGDTNPPVPANERRTCNLHRTLRSGAIVRYDGDLFVFGDVNPGAQVVATGNIIVLGALKGLAHAGAAGDETSFIMAFDLRPTQLRIGRKIAVPPPRRSAPPPTELATVQDGQIVIEAYRGRIRA